MQCQMEPQDHISAIHSSHDMWKIHMHVHIHSTYTKGGLQSSRQNIIVVRCLDSGAELPKFKFHFSLLLVVSVKPWQVC